MRPGEPGLGSSSSGSLEGLQRAPEHRGDLAILESIQTLASGAISAGTLYLSIEFGLHRREVFEVTLDEGDGFFFK